MKNVFNRANAPYLLCSALAIGSIATLGTLAMASYIGFIAPITALSFTFPFIISNVVFSAVVVVLSYKSISKNKVLSERDAQLSKVRLEIKAQQRENFSLKTQLLEKDSKVLNLERKLNESELFYDALEEGVSSSFIVTSSLSYLASADGQNIS